MYPSRLANEIKRGLNAFLTTGFETPTPYFAGIFENFCEQPGNYIRGPYVSMGLPFQQGTVGCDFFSDFKTQYPPYLHQQHAWQRLSYDGEPGSTLIATGTGSGKTECFLFPVLDYCLREKSPGIKAILIYPMNALGTDQARRIAALVAATPAFSGLRVGLYTGDRGGEQRTTMAADGVITDRDALRANPPDILMTNYRMLDFLLLRAEDQRLWQQNTPQTLRYLVVDELHTFDGAQGTDLACLLRRLKGRLATPTNHLICVGTSATLGGSGSASALLDYAETVFGEPFEEAGLIRERTLSPEEFLAGTITHAWQIPNAGLPSSRDPSAYLAEAWQWFFPNHQAVEPDRPEWRHALRNALLSHPFFQALLHACCGEPASVQTLAQELSGYFPSRTPAGTIDSAIEGFLALIAIARAADGGPLIRLRYQVWIRELRRMVAPINATTTPADTDNPGEHAPPALTFADDLSGQHHGVHLPLGHCTECHALSWVAYRPPNETRLETDLREIYARFFKRDRDLQILLPLAQDEPWPDTKGSCHRLCGSCGSLHSRDAGHCGACGVNALVPVFVPDNYQRRQRGDAQQLFYSRDCPSCRSENGIMLFGARSATLGSIAIQHLWANPANDDRKMVAFSDGVQDAAHRAGFFTARAWRNNVRMAIAQYLATQDDPFTLEQLQNGLGPFWRADGGFTDERFVSEFIAPNMRWFNDYRALTETGALPANRALISDIDRRLAWECLAEFAFSAGLGRSLPRTGTVAAGLDIEPVKKAAEALRPRLVEELGMRSVELSRVQQFLYGLALHMLQRGAVLTTELVRYVQNGGSAWLLNATDCLPSFAPGSPRPVFLTSANRHGDFEPVLGAGGTWCVRWLTKALDPQDLLPNGFEKIALEAALDSLETSGLIESVQVQGDVAWGLKASHVLISNDVIELCSTDNQDSLILPRQAAELMNGAPSLKSNASGCYKAKEPASTWLRSFYLSGDIHRVIAAEHTAMLSADERARTEREFIAEASDRKPWHPNLLSATPTLEMGIDIGDLSTVMLCSVPPTQANYLQRIGRAGRRDGNSLNLALAGAAPHDLYFYHEPMSMMAGDVTPPGMFMNAAAVIQRQLFAYCLDRWVIADDPGQPRKLPLTMQPVLDGLDPVRQERFPENFRVFISDNGETVLRDFLALFADALSSETQTTLRAFLLGPNSGDKLEDRLYKQLWAARAEREELNRRVGNLDRRIRELRRDPDDEATRERLNEAQQERGALNALVTRINGKHTLQFLTDEGLIPNYAFPEPGVTLRSVIYFHKSGDDPGENWTAEYERPAASALSELAPDNDFYANGRHVRIRQVYLDPSAAPIETWRFCPECAYAAPEMSHSASGSTECPRCKAAGWADLSQKKELLRLRTVMAFDSDRRSRIADDREDREPNFYQRQIFVDFASDQIRSAWHIDDDSLPFGFEYIRRADFRELNFGEQGVSGNPSSIAGKESVRPGFRICRHCGRVQSRRPGAKADHTVDCDARDNADDSDYTECLYLYRDFQSEAVRILMPVSSQRDADTVQNSFIAGLQLGLRQRYGGQVNHLRVTAYDEPIPGSEMRRQYLVLYDTVPGGTGYLRDFLSDPERIVGLLNAACEVMQRCTCQHDAPTRDGCYSCLYAYRNSYGMESTSRRCALDMFSGIVERASNFVAVDTISDIELNPLFASRLEARFVPALQRANDHGFDVLCQQQIVAGKVGYYLRVGSSEYALELQVPLGSDDDIVAPCRPDFVARPLRSDSKLRPIAIFLDGYEFHKATVADDTRKRSALVRSGRWWQWSLTWKDVQWEKTAGARDLFAESAAGIDGSLVDRVASAFDVSAPYAFVQENALAQLLIVLRDGDTENLTRLAAVRQSFWLLKDNALNRSPDDIQSFEIEFQTCAPTRLKQHYSGNKEELCVGGANWRKPKTGDPIRVFCAAPFNAVIDGDPGPLTVNVFFDDKQQDLSNEVFRRAWLGFWRAVNLLQFLKGACFTSAIGIDQGLYEDIAWDHDESACTDSALAELLEVADATVLDGLRDLAARGLPLPLVGHELTSDDGEVIAEAELAWADLKIAVLLSIESPDSKIYLSNDWVALSADSQWVEAIQDRIHEGASL